jgi:hypothetical protein
MLCSSFLTGKHEIMKYMSQNEAGSKSAFFLFSCFHVFLLKWLRDWPVSKDASFYELADRPPGWHATRTNVGEPWIRA